MFKRWLFHKNLIGLNSYSIFLILSLSLAGSLLEALGLGMFYPVFKMLKNGSEIDISDDYGILDKIQVVFNFIGVEFSLSTVLFTVFLLLIFRQLFMYFKNIYTVKLIYFISMNLRNKLFSGFLSTSNSFQDSISVGGFSNVINREIPNAVSGVISPLILLTYLILLFILVVMLFTISMQMTITAILIFFVSAISTRAWINKSEVVGRSVVSINSDITSFLVERLKAAKLIKSSRTELKEINRFKNLSGKQKDLSILASVLNSKTDAILDPLVVGVSLLFLYISYKFIGMSIEAIGLYMIVFMRMLPLVKSIVQTWQKIKGAFGAIEIVEDKSAEMSIHKEMDSGDIKLSKLKEGISYKNVFYSYLGSSNSVINNLSFDIKKGSSIALVGPSGGGKTTIIELLSRLCEPLSGEVLIDGINIKDLTLDSLRDMISYVQQEPQLFPGTVSDHISYGMKNKNKSDIKNSAIMAGAHDFIKIMPNGYDALLTDNANNLSGGQRQRLDISRAIFQNKPILILDEPTSNLDAKSREYFIRSIDKITKNNNITVIVVAHSLSSVSSFDEILVVEKGNIIEKGTHEELMKNDNGWYKISWLLQSKSYLQH